MTPVELLARLAALIPPPRHPLTRYFGVLASHSKHRSQVVPRLPAPRAAPTARASQAATPSTAVSPAPQQATPSRHERTPGPAGDVMKNDGRRCPSNVDHPVLVPSGVWQRTTHSHGASDPRPAAAAQCFNVISTRHLDRLLGGELMATSARLDWAKLMRRTLALDPLCCPSCGSRLRPIAEISDPDIIERILDHLATRPPRAPPADSAPAAKPAPTLH